MIATSYSTKHKGILYLYCMILVGLKFLVMPVACYLDMQLHCDGMDANDVDNCASFTTLTHITVLLNPQTWSCVQCLQIELPLSVVLHSSNRMVWHKLPVCLQVSNSHEQQMENLTINIPQDP